MLVCHTRNAGFNPQHHITLCAGTQLHSIGRGRRIRRSMPSLYCKFSSHLGYMRPYPNKKREKKVDLGLRRFICNFSHENLIFRNVFCCTNLVINPKFHLIDQAQREQVKIKSSSLVGVTVCSYGP